MEVNYRYSSKNEDKKKDTIDLFLNKPYGTLVMYDEVARTANININTSDKEKDEENLKYLKQFVGTLKNLLIKRGYVIKSVKGCGWYILKPNQISSYTYRNYIVKPQKSYLKASEILQHFEKQDLSEDRKAEYEDINNLNNSLITETDRMLFDSHYYKNKNYYDNLEN